MDTSICCLLLWLLARLTSVYLVLDPRCVSPVMGRGEGSHPLICWWHFTEWTPGLIPFFFFFFRGCTASSCSHSWPSGHSLSRSLVDPQLVQVHGTIPARIQDFALPFIEFHEILVKSFLQPVEAHPRGIYMTYHGIWYINNTSQFCVIYKIAEVHIAADVHSSNLYSLSVSLRETVLKALLNLR